MKCSNKKYDSSDGLGKDQTCDFKIFYTCVSDKAAGEVRKIEICGPNSGSAKLIDPDW